MLHPEYGWKTTNFWGPIANWGLVVAAVSDAVSKGPEVISMQMTSVLALYSGVFMRFAWKVKPRNYLLFACHLFNIHAQAFQLYRGYKYQQAKRTELTQVYGANSEQVRELEDFNPLLVGGAAAAMLGGGVVGQPIRRALMRMNIHPQLKNIIDHAAGPFTIHGWAPVFKWMLSVSNIMDYDRPVEKMSLFQQVALCSTGFIWARYSLVIVPKNYSLFLVNFVLGCTGLYHVARKLKAELEAKQAVGAAMEPQPVVASPSGRQ